ncbi:TlpA family protein disulfide reductase [Sphingobacterium siyangense]|uniref:TlpA family protein disulfide reductase n=1 Tax=Sphingobacterium siyangense TaxID=459529 RepID=UPI0011A13C2A|nr:TlpA disulfide reductase family protein [Sphingobacterium siyangense]
MRKKIRQGKTCFTGTAILLKKRYTISVQNEIKTGGSSGSLRLLFEYPSTLRRTNVAPSSGLLRLLFGCSSGRTRSAAEALPKPSRSVAEHVSNMSRRSPEAEPKAIRRGVGASPSSDFFLTNFAPTSAFHAVGLEFSSAVPLIFPEGDPKPTRRNPEQRWEKGRSWSGIGRYLNGLFLGTNGTVSSPLSYRECTERVPKRYWECTKELPKIYQRGTKQLRAVSSSLADLGYKSDSATKQAAKGEGAGLHNGREGCCSKFNAFKTFCERIAYAIYSFVDGGISMAHRALKYLVYLFDNKSTSRMPLTCLALVFQSSNYSFKVLKSIRALALSALLVSMFSLSAQTPRKDSGGDGPMVIPNGKSLYIGDTIPDEFFVHQNKFIDWVSQKTFTRNLEADRDKLIILDFWASWCRPCLGSLMHLHEILPDLDTTKITIVPVNYEPINKFQHLMDRFKWNHQTIYADTFLMQYFPKRSIPHMVWIKDGRVIAKPYAKYATVENLKNVLDGGMPKMYNALNVKLADLSKPLFINENAPATVLHTKKFFKIGGYVEEYARNISGIEEQRDSMLFYGINQKLDYLLYDIFKDKVFPFYNIDNGAVKNNLTASDRKYLVLDTKQATGLSPYALDSLYEAWSQENLFSYEMRIPKSLGKENGLALLQQYWAEYLKKTKGWNVHIGLTPPISYPVIQAKKSILETRRLFSQPLQKRTGDEYLQYDPSKEKDSEHKLSLVIAALLAKTNGYHIDVENAFNRIGLVKDFPYAYELPRWYFTKTKLTSEELNAFLDAYGLKVEIEKKRVPVLVIGY